MGGIDATQGLSGKGKPGRWNEDPDLDGAVLFQYAKPGRKGGANKGKGKGGHQQMLQEKHAEIMTKSQPAAQFRLKKRHTVEELHDHVEDTGPSKVDPANATTELHEPPVSDEED